MKTILIGKAKKDFYKWYKENIHISKLDTFFNQEKAKDLFQIHFISQSETFKNAIVIEWLDSVGIYVEITRLDTDNPALCWFYSVQGSEINKEPLNTRNQATIKAIEEAVKIYNG